MDRSIVTAVFDYRLHKSIMDNRFFSIEFRIIGAHFASVNEVIKLYSTVEKYLR